MNCNCAELKRRRPDLHSQLVTSYRVTLDMGVSGIPSLWTDTSEDYVEMYCAALHDLLNYPIEEDPMALHVDDNMEWFEQMNVADICGTNLAWARLAARRERAENYPGDNEDPPEVRGGASCPLVDEADGRCRTEACCDA